MNREVATDTFYQLIDSLSERVGGPRRLADSTARTGWPSHGVYFFFEPGEQRAICGAPRVVRVGTHALTATSKTTLWNRLSQHRGRIDAGVPGNGNHRGSIFRHHVGTALLNSAPWPATVAASWRQRDADRSARAGEAELERAVTAHIGTMPLLWLAIPDRHDRYDIEANLIALLSRCVGGIDSPSPSWLGHHADSPKVRQAGLWNVTHVDRDPDNGVLDLLERLVNATGSGNRHAG